MVRFGGAAAGVYDYNRQISASFTAGPYLVMYAAGYADSRPRVPVSHDPYSDAEMTNMAAGVAHSVAHTLAAAPPRPAARGRPDADPAVAARIALLAVAGLVSLAALPAAPARTRPPPPPTASRPNSSGC